MIVVKMMGNLGNQMFIYAMARSLQLRYGDELVLDLSSLRRHYYTAAYKLDRFALPAEVSCDMGKVPPAARARLELTSRLFHLEHYFYRKTREDLVILAGNQALTVRGVFSEEPWWDLSDFSQPLASVATTPFRSAAFAEDGKSLALTYLSGEDFHEVTETIPLPEP